MYINETIKKVQRIQNTVIISTHITKTLTQLSKNTPTYTYPHVAKEVKTTTLQDTQ